MIEIKYKSRHFLSILLKKNVKLNIKTCTSNISDEHTLNILAKIRYNPRKFGKQLIYF